MRSSLNILITDAQELAALGAIRSLGRAGHAVTPAVPESIRSFPSAYSRHAQRSIRCPDPWKRHHEFRHWLEQQARSGRWQAILPLSEAAIFAAAELRSQAPSEFLLLIPDDGLLTYTLSKYCATTAALQAGVPCPRTLFIDRDTTDAEVRAQLRYARFPAILKTDNALLLSGEYKKGRTYLAETAEQALFLLSDLRDRRPLMIQEMVTGYGVGAFFLRSSGETLLRLAHRRLHEIPYTGGYSSFRATTADAEAIELGERLLRHIRYEGLAMVEFRRDPATGITYFLEINGRVWGSIALALHAGVDFPAAYVDCCLGVRPAGLPQTYPLGLRCRHLAGEIAHVLSLLAATRAAGITPARKLRAIAEFIGLSADPRIRHDHFWWSDPLPGIWQGFESGRFLAARVGRALESMTRKRREARRLAGIVPEQQRRMARLAAATPRHVLFLCYGNICRSAFAEHYWNTVLRLEDPELSPAESAGFYPQEGRPTPCRIVDLAAQCFGCDLRAHRSRRVSADMLDRADAVCVMDRTNYQALAETYPAAMEKTFLLGLFGKPGRVEIEDPYLMTDPAQVRGCLDEIAVALRGLQRALGGASSLTKFP